MKVMCKIRHWTVLTIGPLPTWICITAIGTLILYSTSRAGASLNVTVCLLNYQDGLDVSMEESDREILSRFTNLTVHIQLVPYEFSSASFPWFPLTACRGSDESCIGVVIVAPSQWVQTLDSWATNYVIPSVFLSSDSVTSSHTQCIHPEMLQSLVTLLGWSQVAVMLDSESLGLPKLDDLTNSLSEVYVGSLLFRVSSTSTDDIRHHLNTVKTSQFYNIVTMASYNTTAAILEEAQRAGLLNRTFYWILLLRDDACPNIPAHVFVNDTNILILRPVTPGEATLCSLPVSTCSNQSNIQQWHPSSVAWAVEALARAVIEVGVSNESSRLLGTSMCENRTETIEQRSAVRNALMQHLSEDKQVVLDANRCHSRTTYTICSTENGHPGRLANLGQWSQDGGLQLTANKLYGNTFRDFGFRKLRVGTQEAKPFVQKHVVNNSTTFEGFCVDVLRELASVLKFEYEFVEPSDGEWGAPLENGTWTGIIGMVVSKNVDIGLGPFTITSVREQVIDFTKPFMEDGVGILSKKPKSDAKNMFKMFTPLTPPVWGALIGSIIAVSLALYVIEWASPFSARNMYRDDSFGIVGSLWLIYGSYMEQGPDPHPRSVSARCLVGFWWLFTILMTSTYTANLAAFLTVTIEEIPINSLQELAQSTQLKPLVKRGSNLFTLFKEAEHGVYRDIWNKMDGMPTVKSSNEALNYVKNYDYAYMTDASQLEYIMLRDCNTFSLAKELFNTGGFGFVLQQDVPYLEIINYNIMKMQEAGLMDKWRQRWWTSPDPCTSSSRTSEATELDWLSMSGLFYIFIAIAVLSILVRVLEICVENKTYFLFWNRLKFLARSRASADISINTKQSSVSPSFNQVIVKRVPTLGETKNDQRKHQRERDVADADARDRNGTRRWNERFTY